VRANVARWAVEAIDPDAYVVDDTGFPKDGTASPLVARQYSGTLGKTGNCQVGVSVQQVDSVDGQGGRAQSDRGLADLAGVRAQAAPGR
jgi:hypothetical protein